MANDDIANKDIYYKLEEIRNILSKQLTLFKIINSSQIQKVLLETLKKDSEKIAYQYSDGRSSLEISKIAAVSDFAIRSYWKKWATMGLVQSSSKFKGRYERSFSLEDLGIEIPSTKVVTSEQKPAEIEEKVTAEENRHDMKTSSLES